MWCIDSRQNISVPGSRFNRLSPFSGPEGRFRYDQPSLRRRIGRFGLISIMLRTIYRQDVSTADGHIVHQYTRARKPAAFRAKMTVSGASGSGNPVGTHIELFTRGVESPFLRREDDHGVQSNDSMCAFNDGIGFLACVAHRLRGPFQGRKIPEAGTA
jgi:hypothetical protein